MFVYLGLLLTLQANAQHNSKISHEEVSANIPTLSDFHGVIYPLWHDAWPNNNFELMKELYPQVRGLTEKLNNEVLPGILRDKENAWKERLEKLTTSVKLYKQAIDENDETGLKNVVEEVHANYEGLVRAITPLMKELDAFHVVLYKIYHYYMPEKNMDALRTASMELLEKAKALQTAKLSREVERKADKFKAGVEKLRTSAAKLVESASGNNVKDMAKRVETVHDNYQSLEQMFE